MSHRLGDASTKRHRPASDAAATTTTSCQWLAVIHSAATLTPCWKSAVLYGYVSKVPETSCCTGVSNRKCRENTLLMAVVAHYMLFIGTG